MTTLINYQKCILVIFLLSINLISFANEPLKLVTGNDFQPYSDEKLKDGGMFTSLVKSILINLKIPFNIEYYPWARGFEMVKTAKYDATFPYTDTEERKKYVKYSNTSLVELSEYIYANIKLKNKTTVDDFIGFTYCAPLGYYIQDKISKLIDNNKIKKISKFNEKSCLEHIINNEDSFMVSADTQMNEYKKMKTQDIEKVKKFGKPISNIKLYIVYRKDFDNNLIKKIDQEALNFKKTNKYKNILNSY